MELEICQKGEVYAEKDDDLVYDHTKVILRGANGEFFYAKTSQRMSKPINVNELDKIRIPSEHIHPVADPSFTRAPEPLPSTSYVKQRCLLYYESFHDHTEYLDETLSEIHVCEDLRQNPHPNLAKYLGCVVNKEGRISGLVFVRYPITLDQMLKDGTPFDRQRCLSGIKAGIGHMHGLGLIHNDINPTNIMMDGVGDDMKPIVIDFDSCKKEGDKLGPKFGWTVDDEYAKRENDEYGISKIREALFGENESL